MNKLKHILSWLALVLTFLMLIITALEEKECHNTTITKIERPNMKVKFCNISNKKIKECFLSVLERYKNLHKYEIHLHQKKLGNSTMKAQPIIKVANLFSEIKEYKITVGYTVLDSDTLIKDIPEKALKGWFAHELGHISDYEQYSNFRMIVYGIKYLFSDSFKKQVEHEADYIALKNGFKQEIIATKKYILQEGLFSDRYISQINKFYLPLAEIEKEPEDTLSAIYHE